MFWSTMRECPFSGRACYKLTVCSGLVKGVAKAPEIDPQDIDAMFTTNVNGLINMTQAILPIFKKRGDGGHGDIINIGSIAGREAYPGGSIYCATKAAVRTFTDALRKELIATRIRIIGIDPGQVETVSIPHSSILAEYETDLWHRNSLLCGSMETRPRRTQFMRMRPRFDCARDITDFYVETASH